MVDQVLKNTVELNNLVVEIAKLYSPKRLVIFGGSRKSGDNGAFYHASKNVIKDYKNDLPIQTFFIDNGVRSVISALKTQKDNTVQSLDLFCHGDPDAIYFILGASMDKIITREEVFKAKLGSNIYKTIVMAVEMGYSFEANQVKNQAAISSLNFSVFTDQAKIEIHGCNTGNGNDCFASELSSQLYKAGKTQGIVIGHATSANPNIGGTIKILEQDYRHGTRIIYHNGKAIKTVTSSGRITANTIREALGR
jgi:hypothetical protein